MPPQLQGLHHISVIASDPQRNLDFYSGVLGLRLVKRTVDFDEPSVYHLYYGDALGRPGTLLTFFPFPQAIRGREGSGQAISISLSIPRASLGFWLGRLIEQGISYQGPTQRGEHQVLALRDPDGLSLELVTSADVDDDFDAWQASPVPPEHAIRRIHGVTLWEDDPQPSQQFFTEILGLQAEPAQENLVSYRGDGPGSIEVRPTAGFWEGAVSAGSIHHIAWSVGDEQQLLEWRERLLAAGADVTPVRDRHYFQSIYFHEPGGVLFEIATDGPGFTVDEPAEHLGESLQLPPWFEVMRASLGATLPPLSLSRSDHDWFSGEG